MNIRMCLAIGIALLLVGASRTAANGPLEKMKQSVVLLTAPNHMGTGFVTKAKSGLIVTVTNAHVCAEEASLLAERAGEYADVKVNVIESDPLTDLCVLEGAPGKVLPTGSSPTLFQTLYVLGHPLGQGQHPESGRYNGEESVNLGAPFKSDGRCPDGSGPALTEDGLICTSKRTLGNVILHVYPGSSGSPVTDASGRVVGVINSYQPGTNFGSLVPLRYLKAILGRH